MHRGHRNRRSDAAQVQSRALRTGICWIFPGRRGKALRSRDSPGLEFPVTIDNMLASLSVDLGGVPWAGIKMTSQECWVC